MCVSSNQPSQKAVKNLSSSLLPDPPLLPPLPPPPDPFALVSSRRGRRSTRGQSPPEAPGRRATCQQGTRRDLNGESRAGQSGGQEESLNREVAKCSGAGPRYESVPRPLTSRRCWLDPELHLTSVKVCVWTEPTAAKPSKHHRDEDSH